MSAGGTGEERQTEIDRQEFDMCQPIESPMHWLPKPKKDGVKKNNQKVTKERKGRGETERGKSGRSGKELGPCVSVPCPL